VNGQRFWVCILFHHQEFDDQLLMMMMMMMMIMTDSETLDSKCILTRLMAQKVSSVMHQLIKGFKVSTFYYWPRNNIHFPYFRDTPHTSQTTRNIS
jgi:hypothetical protein